MIGYPDNGSSCVLLPPHACRVCRNFLFCTSLSFVLHPILPFPEALLSWLEDCSHKQSCPFSHYFFLPSTVKGKERKCCGSHSQWELILQCENIRIAQLDQSQGSPCTGSHVYLEGAEQKKFKNLSVRQAFSRQHNLILRQSAVYAMPKHMIIISPL